jgi:hypothetical protein
VNLKVLQTSLSAPKAPIADVDRDASWLVHTWLVALPRRDRLQLHCNILIKYRRAVLTAVRPVTSPVQVPENRPHAVP